MGLTSHLYENEVFLHVNVAYNPLGGSTIFWELHPNFIDPRPYTFQLQANLNHGDPNNWLDVGTPQNDVINLADNVKRQNYKGFYIAYRVKLTTPKDVYYSQIATTFGNLTYKQWNYVRAMMRRNTLVPKRLKKYNIIILKKKRFGLPCSCFDHDTRQVTNSDCMECFGTGIVGGYWTSNLHFVLNFSQDAQFKYTAQEVSLSRGTIYDEKNLVLMTGFPMLDFEDIIHNKDNGMFYFVHSVKGDVEVSKVPIFYRALVNLLPPTHPIYKFFD
ncbi:MAG: hypothetical protein QW727_03820 [Candidatus Pacearchaeota archaeon]